MDVRTLYQDFHAVYQQMKSQRLHYVYHGVFSEQLNDLILSFSESRLEPAARSSKIKKKVYHIMVESLQNITRHRDEKAMDMYSGFMIQRMNGGFYVTTANMVENENVSALREKLEKVNSLDRDELKAYYKELLTKGDFSEKGGAGLGLIDIARKSGNKLEFRFIPYNDQWQEFYMQSRISPSEEEVQEVEPPVEFHQNLKGSGIRFIHQGAFNQESLDEVVKLAQDDLEAMGQSDVSGRAFYILAEMVENISLHASNGEDEGMNHPGMLCLGRLDDDYCIVSGNLVEKQDAETLAQTIDTINGYTDEEREELSNGDGKVGLVNMRTRCGKDIMYHMHDISDQHVFFSIQANLALS